MSHKPNNLAVSVALTLLLSFVTTALLLSDDFIHRWLGGSNRAELEFEYVAVLWIINLCFWLSGRRWFVNSCLVLFSVFQLIQLSQIDYAGTPLTPFDIKNLYLDRADVTAVVLHELPARWPVLLAWGVPYGLAFALFNTLMSRPRKSGWIAVVLVAAVLASKPLRAVNRDMIFFMPSPTRSSLHNSINAFSYFLTRMIWQSHTIDRPDYGAYRVEPLSVADPPETIMLVIPDSVRHDRLSVSGYSRPTTPRLSSLKNAGKLQTAEGIAGSVATGSSLPLMINSVREPGNVRALERKTANLFKRAKQAGYRTFWISSMESKLLNDLGTAHIDTIITQEDYMLSLSERGDRAALEQLTTLEWGNKNFIVLNLHTAHSPYGEAYTKAPEPERYRHWPTGAKLSNAERLSNEYDNALTYLDQLLADSITWMRETFEGDALWVMTSDHGQELGEDEMWGHNRMTPRVANVPVLMYQKRDHATDTSYQLPDDVISHYELSKWLLSVMGYRINNPNEQKDRHYLHSDNLFGDNLYRPVEETEQGLRFCDWGMVSNIGPRTSNCETATPKGRFYNRYSEPEQER